MDEQPKISTSYPRNWRRRNLSLSGLSGTSRTASISLAQETPPQSPSGETERIQEPSCPLLSEDCKRAKPGTGPEREIPDYTGDLRSGSWISFSNADFISLRRRLDRTMFRIDELEDVVQRLQEELYYQGATGSDTEEDSEWSF